MSGNIPSIYLVGAIRDGRKDDIDWRDNMIDALDRQAVFLNPVGGKRFNPETKAWDMSGIPPKAEVIVKHDFWCVDKADIIIANMTSLAEGYPSIGSLIEIGRATARGSLIYIILDPNYQGHGNLAMFKLHPFLAQNAAATFDTVDSCITFLSRHLNVLNGMDPYYDGDVHETLVAQ